MSRQPRCQRRARILLDFEDPIRRSFVYDPSEGRLHDVGALRLPLGRRTAPRRSTHVGATWSTSSSPRPGAACSRLCRVAGGLNRLGDLGTRAGRAQPPAVSHGSRGPRSLGARLGNRAGVGRYRPPDRSSSGRNRSESLLGPQIPTVEGFHSMGSAAERSGRRRARMGSASWSSARAREAPRQ